VWLGGIGVLCQIHGEVPGRATLDRWLPGASLSPIANLGTVHPPSPQT